MPPHETRGRRIAVWGFGREGRAALRFLREREPSLDLTVLDDNAGTIDTDVPLVAGRAAIAAALDGFDIVVKSPGISLYDPLVAQARSRGVQFTSLLNLWFADGPGCSTVCITGTKGKSTTTALLTHILGELGVRAMAAGNIGVPVTQLPSEGLDVAVIEVSSYQAADFDGECDLALLTSLSQDHLNWHGSVAAYQHDKLNLLRHARHALINRDLAAAVAATVDLERIAHSWFEPRCDGSLPNAYLARRHNQANLSAALAAAGWLGLERGRALQAAGSFAPLPHRQQERGERGGHLYVDDSISTTPEATIAALDAYRDRAVTVILGGDDRGVDYASLIARIEDDAGLGVVLLGASGARIHESLAQRPRVLRAADMRDAVAKAAALTPSRGIILLSPASPSFGSYRDYIERGEAFARCAGLLD